MAAKTFGASLGQNFENITVTNSGTLISQAVEVVIDDTKVKKKADIIECLDRIRAEIIQSRVLFD